MSARIPPMTASLEQSLHPYNEQAPLCRQIKAAIEEQVKTYYEKGVRRFYVGGTVGVDTWAAEIIIELKKHDDYCDIELFCAIPFPEQTECLRPVRKSGIARYCLPVMIKRLLTIITRP